MINKLITVALDEVGYLEKKNKSSLDSKTANAGSANYTKYARDLSKYNAGIFANGYAWCDTFVDWCFVQAFGADVAKKLIHGWSAYTPTSAGYYKNAGEWKTKAEKGDQIFFKDANGTICHTGIVYDVDSTYVYTVEGNTSSTSGLVANGGSVAKKKYKLNYARIAGYGRPNYTHVKTEEKKEEPMYNKLVDCPQWAQKYIKTAIEKGFVKGDTNGNLNLDDTRIWCLVVMLRIAGIMK